MEPKTIQFIASYPLEREPVIKNRLLPFFKVANQLNYKIQLISPDTKSIDIDLRSFEHIYSPDSKKKPKEFIARMLFEVQQSQRLIKLAKEYNADIRLLTIPSMFLLFNVYLLKNIPFIIDLRDLTWEYIPETGLVNKLAKKTFRFLANKSIKKSLFINVTNTTEKQYLKEQFNIEQEILMVSNGVSLEQFERLSLVADKHLTEPVVAYIGNVGLAQNLINLIDVAEKMPHVKFYIVGEGTSFISVQEYAEERKLNNLVITGRLPWGDVIRIYEEANILYAQLSPDFSSAMPSKLYEYLSTGKYIVYGGQEQAKMLLNDFDNNRVIEPCNSEKLEKTIREVINNKRYLSISNHNKNKIENSYIREKAVVKFFEHLRGVL